MQVTDRAVEALSRLAQEELRTGELIRVDRAYRCGGPPFQVVIDDTKGPLDTTLRFEGAQGAVDVTVAQAIVKLLADVVLDYGEDGFVFEEAAKLGC
ncbi:iron-sulfur cluster assembly accessory protein [Alicyclobacillus vulcanalis]|uniref:Fe-S cluster assembly iron-binding protein IscA n=1 Tax=Alicyclobacillus vulcanalis TaxID=252246 RepID=A0A1N7K1J8_9BACL|nr:iron-sulfur cluster assembly protein [Alicyclobacillus vulcanalis]SIS55463.1 Fe-S cluster assembly iron-binding protein IscA [Alicyclobacillus vulcanalis]